MNKEIKIPEIFDNEVLYDEMCDLISNVTSTYNLTKDTIFFDMVCKHGEETLKYLDCFEDETEPLRFRLAAYQFLRERGSMGYGIGYEKSEEYLMNEVFTLEDKRLILLRISSIFPEIMEKIEILACDKAKKVFAAIGDIEEQIVKDNKLITVKDS